MGGTFDPIHLGHLVVAEEARARFELERVIFVPNGQPPHKKDYRVTDAEHRYAMCLLATASNPFFEVSREELERPGPSYTIDTLRAFRARLGADAQLYFITGADAVLEIMRWREPEAILAQAHVVAVHRPGFDLSHLAAVVGAERAARILTMPTPGLEISSTELRRRVAEGKSIRHLTTDAVVDYIHKMGLYRG